MRKLVIVALFLLAAADHAWSQQASQSSVPVYRITVVARTAKAINYRHRSGATTIDFRGTPLLPQARGEAKVESKQGYIEIEVEFDDLQPATRFGPEYLTYVMWAITPEGRASNLGEVLLNGTKSKLNVTTELQAFGLIVTAEPYFAVTQPSDAVVMENVVRPDTVGKIEEIEAKYELLQRGQYTLNVAPSDLHLMVMDAKTPLELYEARNAVQIARWTGADRYAVESFQKAEQLLRQAESYLARKAGGKPVVMTAREAVQTAEDARIIAIKRIQAEEQNRTRAEAEEAQRAEAAQRVQAQRERAAAEKAKLEAESARELAAREKANAEAARAAALAQQQEVERARQAAAESERLRMKAESDKEQLRRQLLQQLNMILETRDTARGLIVNMSDVLFDTGKWTLKPGAREKLAKIAGIVLAHPGLKLEIEGHTDSVGSDEFNQQLSERRALAVRDFLLQQGVAANAITARGFGESQPVASNTTSAGRQTNRRVEMVVSGDIIAGRVESLTIRR